MNYIFLGPPGSGKGTQAKKLAEKLHLYLFGIGDLMREEADQKTSLGLEFQSVWDKKDGSLVSDDLTAEFILKKINEIPKDMQIVFDGYPRRLVQAQDLEKIISSNQLTVIYINASDESLLKRIDTRRICDKCDKVFFQAEKHGLDNCDKCGGNLIRRQEDDPEVIKKRIQVYNEETKPLIDYYRSKSIFIDIDGEPSIDHVEKEIWEKINERRHSN